MVGTNLRTEHTDHLCKITSSRGTGITEGTELSSLFG